MASVYKRSGSAKYTCKFKDADGVWRTKAGFTDRQKSLQLAHKLEADALAIKEGLVDAKAVKLAEHRNSELQNHLEEYRQHLTRNQKTPEHINRVCGRVSRILDWGDLLTLNEATHESVGKALCSYRDEQERMRTKENKGKGLGHKTFNHYIEAFEGFGRWLHETHRTDSNPFRGIDRMNVHLDVRKKRRALSRDELTLLLNATRKSGTRCQTYAPETRARIYTVAALTGLRKSEIASLTPESFRNLDQPGLQAMLKVEAASSKHRREDNVPVHSELAKQLAGWLKGIKPGTRLFPGLGKRDTAKMMRHDLEHAGLPYTNEDGEDADFHALRHTFISEAANSGIDPIVVKQLARHGDLNMTMKYFHGDRDKQVEGLEKVAFPSGEENESCTKYAPDSSHLLSLRDNVSFSATTDFEGLGTKKPGSDNDCHRVSFPGNGLNTDIEVELRGLEPLTFWLPAKRSPS